MKNILGKLFVGVALAAALFAAGEAKAQYLPTVANSLATCAASAATNINTVLDVRYQKEVLVQVENMNDASGATTITIPYQRSVDNTGTATNFDDTLTVVAFSFNGVTKKTATTNLLTYGCGYIRFPYATNASATVNSTNIVIRYGIKRAGAP